MPPFKEFTYYSKHDRKESCTFEYSRLEMAETKMKAIKRTITTELWFRDLFVKDAVTYEKYKKSRCRKRGQKAVSYEYRNP